MLQKLALLHQPRKEKFEKAGRSHLECGHVEEETRKADGFYFLPPDTYVRMLLPRFLGVGSITLSFSQPTLNIVS